MKNMYFVYVLKEVKKEHFYTGSTNNLSKRLKEHNENSCRSTAGRNWELFCYFAFKSEKTARNFEKYLKTGSGRAFSKNHFA